MSQEQLKVGWSEMDTTSHQDHVIAHVLGATIMGYLIHDEALYALLDIGFIWRIYLDGEMGLLPHPVAVVELDVGEEARREIQSDIDLLLREGIHAQPLRQLNPVPADCLITEVTLHSRGDERRLLISGEESGLRVDTSLSSGDITVDSMEPAL
ncbi:MAG TPA: hypothetical protein VFP47_15065 [Pyrinomonadaceae bacterium]|nr:hypothetical protein [Pyrinomonadaceae bacterium]